MSSMNRENLWELVDIADVAVRVASHLRQKRSGHVPSDDESVVKAIEFLEQAADGGNFMSTGQVKPETPTLRPLNWAVDIYQKLGLQPSGPSVYQDLANYLNEILVCLNIVREGNMPEDLSELDVPITFFSGLGRMLSSQVNQERAHDSFQMSH